MKFSLILLICFFSLNLAKASGYNVGNGGDVLVCEANGRTQTRLLDLVEMKHRYGLKVAANLKGAPLTLDSSLEVVFRKIARRYPAYSKKIQKMYYEFWSLIVFVDSDIPDVNDEGEYYSPEGCQLRQAAVNFTHPSGRYIYYISQDIWVGMSVLERALLSLHELIYWEYTGRPNSDLKNSEEVRKLVGVLASDSFDDPKYQGLLDKYFSEAGQ